MTTQSSVGGRPRGEARLAIKAALEWFEAQRRVSPLVGSDGEPLIGATWPELMQKTGTSWKLCSSTLSNLLRAGELIEVGRVRMKRRGRPLNVYAINRAQPSEEGGPAREIQELMQSWGRQP